MNGDTWRGWMGRPVIIHPRWRINVRENFKAEFPIFHARGSKFFNSSKLESREARDSTLSVNQTFSSFEGNFTYKDRQRAILPITPN